MEKRKNCDKSASKSKKQRKSITLEDKLEVVKRYERNERTVDIVRATGISESTLRTIRSQADQIKESCKSAVRMTVTKITQIRPPIMEKLERMLGQWIEHQNQRNIALSTLIIQSKARKLFETLNATEPDPKIKSFTASAGWFERFKGRHGLHNIKLTGEAASADVVAAEKFPAQLRAAVEEHGYLPQQVFNLDETGLYWKRMPSRTFLSVQESSAPGFKTSKDRLTLLLGGNASGDYKIKPLLVYHSENPRALKGCPKGTLPVVWRSNKKSWITRPLFESYFSNELRRELKAYCEKINVPFKILLLLDNAPGHPPSIADADENINVRFLPPNTTSLIQPMDQGVISTFKSYYLRRTFVQLVEETEREDQLSVKEFWKNYNIRKAIENIGGAWGEVSESCMKGVWKKIWPDATDSECNPEDELSNSRRDIVDMARQVGFEDVDETNVDELLESHTTELTNEDLLELEEEMNEEEEAPPEAESLKHLSTKQIAEFLKNIESSIRIIEDNDPDSERSAKVARDIQRSVACYKELYREKKNAASQLSLDLFFKKDKDCPSTTPGPQVEDCPSTTPGSSKGVPN